MNTQTVETTVNVNNLSIDEVAKMFGRIYFSTQNYGRSGEYLFLRLIRSVGASTRFTYRHFDEDNAIRSLAKIISWYCAVTNRYSITISEIMWSKYPSVCPRCLESVCACTEKVKKIDEEALALKALENQSKKPNTLNEWQLMFSSIYPPKAGVEGASMDIQQKEVVSSIYSRIFEEIAEVSEVISLDEYCDKNKNSYLKNELADVMAWMFSLLNTLNYHQRNKLYMAGDILHKNYPNSCSKCMGTRCVCVKGDYAIELSQKGVIGLSHHDEMLGLANRNALELFLKKHKNNKYYCLFIDVDNFGRINKEHSDSTGDYVLKKVAECLSKNFNKHQKQGTVFRKGGEEFIITILNCDSNKANFIAEDIRRSVESLKIISNSNEAQINVTISIGLSENDTSDDSIDSAVVAADEYMRDAKENGKNTVRPICENLKEIIKNEVGRTYIS